MGVATKDDDVLGKIMRAVGGQVAFHYPGNEGRAQGTLKDRHVLASGRAGVPYWDVVDLIEFPEEPETTWIRIGYYRKPGDRLVWGSQTTIAEPIGTWRELLAGAAKSKPWFRELLEQVLDEVSGSKARTGRGG
jgi:hypothetical protein